MTEKFSPPMKDRRYAGTDVDVTYNLKRCIHAAYCVDKLAQVFDREKRPWINADGARSDEVAAVIERCPSGSLHYERKDAIPDTNTVIVWHNGPLQFTGALTLNNAMSETRATLCRCGASNNKPFCDNTHKEIGFSAVETLTEATPIELAQTGGMLKVTPETDGPLEVEGNLMIMDEAGNILYKGTQTWLCRCGGSNNKPFCDRTHKKINFKAD